MADARRALPRLIAFSDTTRAVPELMFERFARLGQRALPGSVLLVLRDYTLSVLERFALGERMMRLAALSEQRFGLADRADLARALGCTAFTYRAPAWPPTTRVATSVPKCCFRVVATTPERAFEPEPELDALLVSPIFEARKGRPALGLDVLAQMARRQTHTAPALFALEASPRAPGRRVWPLAQRVSR